MGDRATRMSSVTLIKGPRARSMRSTLRRHGKSATQPIRLAPSPILGPEAQKNIITIVGRGHSGTRAISHTLRESGVYTGEPQNESSDLLPPDDMYEAVKVMNRHVKYLGNLRWDFTKLHTMPIDPVFIKLIESYLSTVLNSKAEWRGWKIPETTLVFPWIVRLFPEIRYIFWIRDPRDAILGAHATDDLADWGLEYDETDDMRLRRAIFASCSLRSVTSRATVTSPTWAPFGSNKGVVEIETSRSSPVLVRFCVSIARGCGSRMRASTVSNSASPELSRSSRQIERPTVSSAQ